MHEISANLSNGRVLPTAARFARASHLETRVIHVPADIGHDATRAVLTDEAEYGRWELARVVVFRGGSRKVWLQRRVIPVRRTDVL